MRTVGPGPGESGHAGHAAPAGDVLHDDFLSQILFRLARKRADDGVKSAARTEGDGKPYAAA